MINSPKLVCTLRFHDVSSFYCILHCCVVFSRTKNPHRKLLITICKFAMGPTFAIFVLVLLVSAAAVPLQRSSEEVQAVGFLRRFGYLPSSNGSSEAIFDHASVVLAIKQMQAYGGLVPTGELDNPTIELLNRKRCGLPDADGHGHEIGSLQQRGLWQKRRITYSFQNWLSTTDPKVLEREMEKAFAIWSPYSRLTFKKEQNPKVPGDISILFARGQHGDSYPFDGQGAILAHAFLPNGNGKSLMDGDIHFDADEEFVMDPDSKRGWYFLAVAAHEIGHSLGLSHSPDADSIMFPYYQQSSVPQLGSTDIMNLYTRYVQRVLPDPVEEGTYSSGEQGDEPREPGLTSTATPSTTKSSTSTVPTPTPRLSTTSAYGQDPKPNDVDESTRPNICEVDFDSIAFLRNELFVFKDKWMWRLRDRGQPDPAYPALISRLFPALEPAPRIDAAFERDLAGKLLFFSGRKYWEFEGTTPVRGTPRFISEFGIPPVVDRVEAAFIWEKNRATYFFSGDNFWRYNETENRMDPNYPQSVSRWGGVPSNLKAIITWRDGKTYFFRGDEFWRFNDSAVEVENGYPMNTKEYWFHC